MAVSMVILSQGLAYNNLSFWCFWESRSHGWEYRIASIPEPCLVQTGLGNYSTPLTLSLLPCPVAGMSAYRAPLHFSFSEKKVAVSFY